ncbi:hypothetical protein GCM10027277_19980 [Pseudoduganella ginsengisoli]|uniref:Uncharacterized protein n=1 Tax=Pseudoduganella ginsengisoli TaxID=1462440 RepID=A0A6L6PU79_9BURK|nr:hypothetical protein [Pseudoduganella ginsengisoli]MTW00746.1 hypothetical protein [Pseudoduganella ginsengisoli]
MATLSKSGFEKWQDGISKAAGDSKWNAWDCDLRRAVKYQRTSIQQVIIGWRPISTSMVAHRYNGGGDPNYAKKLDFALSLIRKGKEASCVR